jgi:predicted nucleotidyltransferase
MYKQMIRVLSAFNNNQVKYLVIGGFAVNLYGVNRSTGDIDLYVEDTPQNRKNMRQALADAEIGDFEALERVPLLPGFLDFTLDFGLRLDLMSMVNGLENISLEELLDKSTLVEMEGVTIPFIDYNSLILSKKAANRLKDQSDIEELEKISN